MISTTTLKTCGASISVIKSWQQCVLRKFDQSVSEMYNQHLNQEKFEVNILEFNYLVL